MVFKIAFLVVGFVALAAGAEVAGQDTKQDEDSRLAVTTANNAFAFDLYEVLRKEKGNIIVSPISAATILSLAYLGAAGNTAMQMRTAMHLPETEQRIITGYRALIDSFQSSKDLTLRMANKVFTDKRFQVKERFQKTATDSFRSAAEQVDFAKAAEQARLTINSWVEEITEKRIKDLIQKDTLDPTTVMVLVNAIYFKGAWSRPFYPQMTRSEPFHISTKEQKNVQMMHRTGQYLYCGAIPGMNARAIELPYKGEQYVRMLILLPNEIDGLPEVESKMRQLDLTTLRGCMTSQEVILSVPKFTIESTFQLHKILPELGIKDLFDSGVANLTGITDQSIFVSKAIQKAFVEVNENGTIASAATELEFSTKLSLHKLPGIPFRVNQPFVFALVDKINTLLFIGRTDNP